MATVTLKNLKKVYPHIGIYNRKRKGPSNLQITEEGVVAVQSFSMEIKDKEFIVLVGPSGCGKSTTLRMIAGLEDITEGELMIDGVRVNEVMPKNRDIAMVFQNYALYPHMTVYKNLAFALELRKWSKEDIDRKVRETAEILDITECLNRKPKQLSGGQKQRVAIGRAIVRNPKVFLMDEPLSNLDAKLRTQMRAELIKLRRRVDTTFVYVTHDQTEAMTLGDRIVIMSDGYIKQIGTPQEVFDHPDNLFVAGFIGSPQMNFIDADLHRGAGSYEVLIAGKSVHVGIAISDVLKERDIDSRHITLGIRPEHITVSRHGDLSGIVEVSEMMGSSVHLHVNCGEYNVVIVAPVVDLPPQNRTGFAPGTEIRFYMNMNFIHLFGEDGNNLI